MLIHFMFCAFVVACKEAEKDRRQLQAQVESLQMELENSSKVFKLHFNELAAKEEELKRAYEELEIQKTIIEALREN